MIQFLIITIIILDFLWTKQPVRKSYSNSVGVNTAFNNNDDDEDNTRNNINLTSAIPKVRILKGFCLTHWHLKSPRIDVPSWWIKSVMAHSQESMS